MSKAFITESDGQDDEADAVEQAPVPAGKNYVTPTGFAALQEELRQLQRVERPKIVEIVSWAAGNGDRSENGDYIYGKKRLREIDRRVRYLQKQIGSAVVVDPAQQQALRQVFFGATVTYADEQGSTHTYTLVGIDEADLNQHKISWLSPLAKALLKAGEGDEVTLRAAGGTEKLYIERIEYRMT